MWGSGEPAPLFSQVPLLIASVGFLLRISEELEVEPGKLGNEPGSGERSAPKNWGKEPPSFFPCPS